MVNYIDKIFICICTQHFEFINFAQNKTELYNSLICYPCMKELFVDFCVCFFHTQTIRANIIGPPFPTFVITMLQKWRMTVTGDWLRVAENLVKKLEASGLKMLSSQLEESKKSNPPSLQGGFLDCILTGVCGQSLQTHTHV